MRNRGFRGFLIALFLTAAAAGGTSGCAANPTSGTPDVVFMNESREIGIGESNDPAIREKYGVYQNAELQAYVDRVGQKLAAQSHRPTLKYHFIVLDSTEVNAFALPGGYIYITRGILAFINSEAELAAILGHAIGHVTARHAVRQHTAATTTDFVGLLIGSATGVQENRDLFNDTFGKALLLGYGRELELESDRLGAEYMARAGYDPEAIFSALTALKNHGEYEKRRGTAENREVRIYHGVHVDFPDADRRLREAVGLADRFKTLNEPKLAREEYLKQIDRLLFEESARHSLRRGGQYFHRDLNFVLGIPDGWTIEYDSYYILRLVSRDKLASLQIESETRKEEITAEDFLKSRMKTSEFDQGGPVMNLALKSYTGVVSPSPSPGTNKTRAAAVQLNNRFFLFQGTVKESGAFAVTDPFFLSTIRSLRARTDKEKLLPAGQRLRLVRAKAGDNFTSLAKRYSVSDDGEYVLRLINGKFPIGEPKAGELIKIIE